MDKKEKLMELVKNMPGAYYEFIDDVERHADTDDVINALIDLIENKPDVNTDDVDELLIDMKHLIGFINCDENDMMFEDDEY